MVPFDHNEKNRHEWLKKEKMLRKTIISIILITILLVAIIICDVFLFQSVILSIISACGSIASVVGIILQLKNKSKD